MAKLDDRQTDPGFLSVGIPTLLNLLQTDDHVQRKQILEVLHELSIRPDSKPFKSYAKQTIDLLFSQLLSGKDNEHNTLRCMNIILNAIQHRPWWLATKGPTFLHRTQELLAATEQLETGHTGGFRHGAQSLKVLSECLVIAGSIFEVYPQTVPQGITLLPLIKSILFYQAGTQEESHSNAAPEETIFTGVRLHVENKTALITTQVQAMSLLAHILRDSKDHYQQLVEIGRWLPNIVVRLLKDCPSSGRKELLTATRSLINFNFRKVFIPIIEELLDERTLVGHDLTAVRTLKTLAYSVLADLTYHVYNELPSDTMFKVVELYIKALQDDFLPTRARHTPLNLLQNMASSLPLGPVGARHCWTLVLDAIGDIFAGLERQCSRRVEDGVEATPEWGSDTTVAGPIKLSAFVPTPVADNKELVRKLMATMKEVISLLEISITDASNAETQPASAFSAQERQTFLKLTRGEGETVVRAMFEDAEVKEYLRTFDRVAQFNGMTAPHEPRLVSDAIRRGTEHQILDGFKHIVSLTSQAPGEFGSEPSRTEMNFDLITHGIAAHERTNLAATYILRWNIVAEECFRDASKLQESEMDLMRKMCETITECCRIDQFPSQFYVVEKHVTEQLVRIFAKWLEAGREEVDAVIRLVDALATDKLTEPPGLLCSIIHTRASTSFSFRDKISSRCLSMYARPTTSQLTKCYLLRYIVTPIVVMDTSRHQQDSTRASIVNHAFIDHVRSSLWMRDSAKNSFQELSDFTALEALQLSTVLVIHHHHIFLRQDCQDIIAFSAQCAKRDDPTIKYAGCVLMGYCMAHFEAPADLITQTYDKLLQNGPQECRALILQGLELIVPLMHKCNQRLDDENAAWAVSLREVLTANRTSNSHRATLVEFVVGHPELFEHVRHKITGPLVDCLHKVAVPSDNAHQTRALATKVILLIWGWDHNGGSESDLCSVDREKINTYLVECMIRLPHWLASPAVAVAGQSPFGLCERSVIQYWGVPDGAISRVLEVLADEATRGTLTKKKVINAVHIASVMLCLKSASGIAMTFARIRKSRQLSADSNEFVLPQRRSMLSIGKLRVREKLGRGWKKMGECNDVPTKGSKARKCFRC